MNELYRHFIFIPFWTFGLLTSLFEMSPFYQFLWFWGPSQISMTQRGSKNTHCNWETINSLFLQSKLNSKWSFVTNSHKLMTNVSQTCFPGQRVGTNWQEKLVLQRIVLTTRARPCTYKLEYLNRLLIWIGWRLPLHYWFGLRETLSTQSLYIIQTQS